MKYFISLFILFLTSCQLLKMQIESEESNRDKEIAEIFENKRETFRIMFYNVENLFDVFDDPEKYDEDFTPNGLKFWNWSKFNTKLWHISQVITNLGGWSPPEIVALCEIENYYVLEQLTQFGPLKVFGYKIVQYESPDERGVDVALLFIPSKFKILRSYPIRINFPFPDAKPTRDILYVKGIVLNTDTLHIFVNHWPSRLGGMLESEPKRMYVASILRKHVDSLFALNPNAKIYITGDFNDFPTNNSLLKELGAKGTYENIKNIELYNLSYYLQEVKQEFTHRFQGEEGILDQIIVSGSLLDTNSTIYTTINDAHVFKAEFLLTKDPNFYGYVPFRTYNGGTYLGGYSDHLPTYCDIYIKSSKKVNQKSQ